MRTTLQFLKAITLTIILGNTAYMKPVKAQQMPKLAANQLVLPSETYNIPFYWLGDSVNSGWEAHSAILIPVKLKNCPKQFYMQFDSGSPYSLLYSSKLKAIHSKYPKALQMTDSAIKLTDFSFKAGKMPLTAKEIVIRKMGNESINWKNRRSIEIIGTFGTDLIDGKVLIIDYPNKKMTISENIPAELNPQLALSDFIYAGRSIMFPATVQGKKTMLYFDSGSSRYELLTDKKTAQALAVPNTSLVQSKVKSWDRILTANSLASNESIEIGNTSIPVHYATYMEGASNSQVEQMMKMGIGGMTGNKIFLDYKLVLDTKNKKFGLIRSLKTLDF